MNLLFVGYWNLSDALTTSTVLPHLKILTETRKLSKLVFTNVQRSALTTQAVEQVRQVGAQYKPMMAMRSPFPLINLLVDFLRLPLLLRSIIKEYQIDFVIARSSLAAGLIILIPRCKVPLVVESFEPHADYMLSVNVWKRWDPRYVMGKWIENKLLSTSKYLITVSNHYKEHLATLVNPNKLFNAPCSVDVRRFQNALNERSVVRKKLGIGDEVRVVVYAGKFGGLYEEQPVFKLAKQIHDQMEGRFYLLLLTDANPKWVGKCSQKYNLPISKIHQEFVPYEQIPSLLASADFAIAPFKQTEFSIFLSPVKVGEYLASGLPVILSKRLGDETERLLEAGAAIEVDFNHLNNKVTISKLKVLNQILSDPWHRQRIRKLAIELRNFDNVRQIYNKILE